MLIIVKILENNEKKEIIINQKQISTFEPTEIPVIGICALMKMSNGDEFVVIDPPFDQWKNDAYIADPNY